MRLTYYKSCGQNCYCWYDVASGGLITTLLEMCFSDVNLGAEIDLSS